MDLFCVFVFAFCDVCLFSLVDNCWDRDDFLALLYVMFSCAYVTFQCGVLGQVCYLIVSIPDLCFLSCCTL